MSCIYTIQSCAHYHIIYSYNTSMHYHVNYPYNTLPTMSSIRTLSCQVHICAMHSLLYLTTCCAPHHVTLCVTLLCTIYLHACFLSFPLCTQYTPSPPNRAVRPSHGKPCSRYVLLCQQHVQPVCVTSTVRSLHSLSCPTMRCIPCHVKLYDTFPVSPVMRTMHSLLYQPYVRFTLCHAKLQYTSPVILQCYTTCSALPIVQYAQYVHFARCTIRSFCHLCNTLALPALQYVHFARCTIRSLCQLCNTQTPVIREHAFTVTLRAPNKYSHCSFIT